MEAIPMCLGTIRIEQYLSNTNLFVSLIIVELGTRFDPAGSSSGLYYEPSNVRKLCTSFGCKQLRISQGRKQFSNITWFIMKA